MRANLLSEFAKNPYNLSPLLILEFANPVVGLYYFSGLNIHRATRCTLVVNNARNLTLQSLGNRNNQSPVA